MVACISQMSYYRKTTTPLAGQTERAWLLKLSWDLLAHSGKFIFTIQIAEVSTQERTLGKANPNGQLFHPHRDLWHPDCHPAIRWSVLVKRTYSVRMVICSPLAVSYCWATRNGPNEVAGLYHIPGNTKKSKHLQTRWHLCIQEKKKNSRGPAAKS
jgi:hypothetical protein